MTSIILWVCVCLSVSHMCIAALAILFHMRLDKIEVHIDEHINDDMEHIR